MILHRHGYLSPDIEQVEAVIAAAICEALDEVAEMARERCVCDPSIAYAIEALK